MKFSKFCFTLATAVFAAGAFADAANVLISFSTEADTYADGTPVKDGEWYALCWTADGSFDGLDLDCNPVDPAEKVLVVAPLAENGHCPFVIFQIDSKVAPVAGNYFVYVLDTRNASGTAVASAKKNADGKRVPATEVNGAVASKSFTAAASIGANNANEGVDVSGRWVASTVAEAKQPRITAFKVENAKVKITVADMMPGVKYNIVMGDSPTNLTSYGLDVPKTINDDPTFEIDPGDAMFFRVVRQPLSTKAE